MTDYKYFPEVNGDSMEPEFMDKLVSLRELCGFALPVTSSFRSPKKNKAVGGKKNSAHLLGRAVDIAIRGDHALQVIWHAQHLGFTGYGIKQHGRRRYLHLDDLPNTPPKQPRPWLWSYP